MTTMDVHAAITALVEENKRSNEAVIKQTKKTHDETVAHNTKDDERWERILPVVVAFEQNKIITDGAKKSGTAILWFATFVTAVGGAYLIIKQIFFHSVVMIINTKHIV